MTIRTRFAPSPTGMLHVGNARTALITWLFARSAGGEFWLRIDDTDTERSKAEYEVAIKESLQWLGMDWDETRNQKDRTDVYAAKIEELKASGRLYACYETPEELSLKRKSQLSRGKPPIYDRAALELSADEIAKHEAEGRTPHWRFKMDHAPIIWQDHIRGAVKFQGGDMSDPVVIRENGLPLYHLCSVIDDIDFGMTHVVRGEDHVSNTATHVQMFEALGAKPPEFAHLPLIADSEGGKLSKRLGSLSIYDIRDEDGLEPMAVVSLLSRMGTSDPIEEFDAITPLVESFGFDKFSRGTPKFDADELLRLNARILHDTPFSAVQDRLPEGMDETFWNTVRPNLERVSDTAEWWRVANGPVQPVIEDAEFAAQAAALMPPAPWDSSTWSSWVSAVKDATGRKGKQLFMPIRQALTGMDHGPELDTLLLLIGPEKALERLNSGTKKAA